MGGRHAGIGTNRNLSESVVSGCAGMTHDGQEAMFPDLDKLLELERLKLERARVKLQRKALKNHKHTGVATARPRDKRPYLPQNKAHRTYDSCRASFQEYERAVVAAGVKVTPDSIYAYAGGPSPKTQERTLALYGLRYPHNWPPSTWPDTPPLDRKNLS